MNWAYQGTGSSKENPQQARLKNIQRMLETIRSKPDEKIEIELLKNRFMMATGASQARTNDYLTVILKSFPDRFVFDEDEGWVTYLSDKAFSEKMKAFEELKKKLAAEKESKEVTKSD